MGTSGTLWSEVSESWFLAMQGIYSLYSYCSLSYCFVAMQSVCGCQPLLQSLVHAYIYHLHEFISAENSLYSFTYGGFSSLMIVCDLHSI